jgi:hypothetical protein
MWPTRKRVTHGSVVAAITSGECFGCPQRNVAALSYPLKTGLARASRASVKPVISAPETANIPSFTRPTMGAPLFVAALTPIVP